MGILLQNLLFKTIFEQLKSAGMIISGFLLTVKMIDGFGGFMRCCLSASKIIIFE
jgi:hypothetical protein